MEARWYQNEANEALMACLTSLCEACLGAGEVEEGECGNEGISKCPVCKDIPTVHPIVVAPTGSGKSLMICDFIDRYISANPLARILVLSHVKEILHQDYEAIVAHFEYIDVGLYSAGMGSRTTQKITVAGIQSVYNKPELFEGVEVIIIDECHLVTIRQNGMYRKFLSHMKANYVGFTATHFRLGHGYIHKGEGALFNKIAYDMSRPEIFNRLVKEGYLTRLIPKATDMRMDVRNIKTRAQDFALDELSRKFDRESITNVAVDEIIEYGHNYKKWLIFGIDIDHAEHITNALLKRDVPAAVVHSKMDGDRDEVVQGFKDGKYRAVVNVDILTTGLDVPDIDLIAMLRPTHSPVIHVQTIGRGLRVAPGKTHCLVLDFAGNTARLGPINDVRIRQNTKKKGDQPGEAPVKECPDCKALLPPALKICDVCGYVFKFQTNLVTTAGTEDIVKGNVIKWHLVDNVAYSLHKKAGKPDSMKVTYRVGLQSFNEWVMFGHDGWVKYKADNWVRYRAPQGMPWPNDVEQLLEFAPWMKQPTEVYVNFRAKFPEIQESNFGKAFHWLGLDSEDEIPF